MLVAAGEDCCASTWTGVEPIPPKSPPWWRARIRRQLRCTSVDCDYGAWAADPTRVHGMRGSRPASLPIPNQTTGDRLEFRVNRTVIVLNNVPQWRHLLDRREDDGGRQLGTGGSSAAGETSTGRRTSPRSRYSRTRSGAHPENHAPVALDDSFGVRPGARRSCRCSRMTPTSRVTCSPSCGLGRRGFESAGRVELIDGNRAIQFTPARAPKGRGFVPLHRDDGRPGGVAEATVTVTVRSPADNVPPLAFRIGACRSSSGSRWATTCSPTGSIRTAMNSCCRPSSPRRATRSGSPRMGSSPSGRPTAN